MRRAALAIAACLVAMAPAGPAGADEEKRPPGLARVVIATDVGAGVDDAWAIAHLALEPGIELAGVVTSYGPGLPDPAARASAKAAREVLTAVGRGDVKVVPGMDGPFGWEQDIKPSPATDFLLAAARGHTADRPLTIALLGPATDVALAFVVDPTLADRVEIVAMGFEGWPKGGDRANVKQDVEAWRILLHGRVPLVVGDVAVGKRDLVLTRERAQALAANRGAAGAWLAGRFGGWLDRHADHAKAVTGRADAWPMWDEAVAAWLLGRARAESRPRPALNNDATLVHGPVVRDRRPVKRGPPIRWITAIEAEPTWNAFGTALDRRAAAER